VIHTRPCTPQDVSALILVVRNFFGLHRQFLGEIGSMTDSAAQEILQETLKQPSNLLIVAEDTEAGQLVGFARWGADVVHFPP
jgi:hypothetical protein